MSVNIGKNSMTLIRTKFKGPSRFCYYYLITNLLTGRRYVGYRLANGKYPLEDTKYFGDYSKPLLEDIEKFGMENFTKVILRHERFVNKVTSSSHESMFMHMYDTLNPNGYNLYDPGKNPGFSTSGVKQTDERRAKQSIIIQKVWQDPEKRKNIEESLNRQEVKAKMSASQKKAWQDEEYRAKQSARLKIDMNRQEVKAKMSASQKKRLEDPAERAKLRANAKKQWQDEEYRAKQSARLKIAMNRQEVREKRGKPVAQYALDGTFLQTFIGAWEAMFQTGAQEQNITMCCKGRGQSAGGFQWRYYEGNTDDIEPIQPSNHPMRNLEVAARVSATKRENFRHALMVRMGQIPA